MTSEEIHEVAVDQDIDAPVEEVWEALTSTEGWAGWMGRNSTLGDDVGEPLYAADPVTGEPKRGQIDEFDAGRRLGYRWWPEQNPDQTSHVAITLTPCESGTRVTVVETVPGHAVCSATAQSASWMWRGALVAVVAPRFHRFFQVQL